MNILFYLVSRKRAHEIESQAIEFAKKGHTIFLLTQGERSELHDFFESKQFHSFHRSPVKSIFPVYLIAEVIKLVWFCYRHKITHVHAHLDPCSLIAVCSQPFMRSKVIVTRHHADALVYETSKKNQRISSWIYRTARHVVAVSPNVKNYMVEKEGAQPDRIKVIPLSFDFDLYELPSETEVKTVREKYNAPLLFCTAGRLISLKRIDLAINLIHRLTQAGVDCKLIILGTGPMEASLKKMAEEQRVGDRVFFPGFTKNILSYMAASDYYIHFSVTEATCTVVKEAGLVKTPAIVCEGVGDFNDYIVHGKNGYLVSKTDPVADASDIIVRSHLNKEERMRMGIQLRETVLSYFDIKRVGPLYHALHDEVLNA